MRNCLFMCVLLGLVGCEDDVQPANGPMGGGGATTEDMGVEDATPVLDAAQMMDVFVPLPPPEPAFVELTIDPRRSLYTREEHPTVTAVVYDRIGREIEGAMVRWDVQPEGVAELQPDQTLNFLQQGQGAVRGCANPDLCGRVSFFVDDGPPTLELTTPMAGAVMVGQSEPCAPLVQSHPAWTVALRLPGCALTGMTMCAPKKGEWM